MKTSFRLDGGKELAKALSQLSARASKTLLMGALTEAAEPIRRRMEQNAPVSPDAPHLRDRMVIRPSRGVDTRESAVAVGATKGGYYGSFQEFGTAHHGPQPWARPAWEAEAGKALEILGASIWRELAGKGISRGMVTQDVAVEGEEV